LQFSLRFIVLIFGLHCGCSGSIFNLVLVNLGPAGLGIRSSRNYGQKIWHNFDLKTCFSDWQANAFFKRKKSSTVRSCSCFR